MLKPVISMNKMSMNESIATTCCYVWNGNSLLGAATLPHGGKLVADAKTDSFVQIENTRYPLNSTWWDYTDGHAASGAAARSVVTKTTDGKWGYHDYANPGTFTLMENGQVTKEFCDHKNPEICLYFKVTEYLGTFTHVGATSAHYNLTSGNEWLADHPAQQYMS